MLPPNVTPHNFILFKLHCDVTFPSLHLLLFLSDLKSTILRLLQFPSDLKSTILPRIDLLQKLHLLLLKNIQDSLRHQTYFFANSIVLDFVSLGLDRHGYFLGRRGIEPKTGLNPFLKTALNVFCMHKTDIFFLEFCFLYLIQYIGGYNRNKTRPGFQF